MNPKLLSLGMIWDRSAGVAPVLAMLIAVMIPGCEAEDAQRPGPAAPPVDKAALFGDPTLVPTRAGERARRELSLAQPIHAAIELLPAVHRTEIDVELPAATDPSPPRVLAVLQIDDAGDPTAVERDARRIAQQVVGLDASVEVVTISEATPAPIPTPAPPRWPLVIGLLGLGFCSGVLVERVRRARGLRPPRRASGRR